MFHNLGRKSWLQDHGIVLLRVHGWLADQKKKHRQGCALRRTFDRDTTALKDKGGNVHFILFLKIFPKNIQIQKIKSPEGEVY